MASLKLSELDVVALTEDVPTSGLRRGQVGTVVAVLGEGEAFEVEFVDGQGQTYALTTLRPAQLLVLRFESATA